MNEEDKNQLAITLLDKIKEAGGTNNDMMDIAEIMKGKAYKDKVNNLI